MITRTMMDGGDGSRLSDSALDVALTDVEDLMDRALIRFFLLGDTAKSIIEHDHIYGEKIEVGVRALDMAESTLRTIKILGPENWHETPDGYAYTSHGVPIEIKVIQKPRKFLDHPDRIFYRAGDYLIPNPFKNYYQTRGLLK